MVEIRYDNRLQLSVNGFLPVYLSQEFMSFDLLYAVITQTSFQFFLQQMPDEVSCVGINITWKRHFLLHNSSKSDLAKEETSLLSNVLAAIVGSIHGEWTASCEQFEGDHTQRPPVNNIRIATLRAMDNFGRPETFFHNLFFLLSCGH